VEQYPTEKCKKGNRKLVFEWCIKCEKDNIYKRYCDALNRAIERGNL
jgi:hypothetical protein